MEWLSDLILSMGHAVDLSLEPVVASAMVAMMPTSLMQQIAQSPTVAFLSATKCRELSATCLQMVVSSAKKTEWGKAKRPGRGLLLPLQC